VLQKKENDFSQWQIKNLRRKKFVKVSTSFLSERKVHGTTYFSCLDCFNLSQKEMCAPNVPMLS
jgi:hypothetical protein